MKRKYDGLIVVEGKNDKLRLEKLVDADILITEGLKCSEDTISTIRQASKTREILVFTDPDSPGNRIRARILREVPQAKQAFVQKKDAIGKSKVGVEHAGDEAILEALDHLTPGKGNPETLSFADYLDLGLSGQPSSRKRRRKAAEALHIGMADGKTFYKWLNLAGVKKEDLERIFADGE